MELGDRIREIRGKTNITSFCNQFGIHRNTLPRYESGERLPDAGFLKSLCEAYSLHADWLLLGEGPKHWGEEQEQQATPTTNGNGHQVSHLEDPFITDIKLFLNEMTGKDPEWRSWFKMELIRKIDIFREWLEEKQKKVNSDNSKTNAA